MPGRIGRNFAFLAASNLLAPVFSMVLVLAISRLRGAEELGKYSLVMTWFVVGQSIAGFGLPVIVTREVSQRTSEGGRYFLAASVVSFVLVLPILICGAFALSVWQQDPEMRFALLLMLLLLIPSGVAQAGEGVLLAYERAPDFVMINLSETIMRAVVGSMLVFAGRGICEIAVAIATLRVLAAGAFAIVLPRRGATFSGGVDLPTCWALGREAPVVGAIPIVNQLYARADVFLLSTFGSWADVGVYSAALRLIDITRTVAPAYARALYPALARLVDDPVQFVTRAREALRRTGVLAALLTVGCVVGARPLIQLLFGPRVEGSAPLLQILAWVLVPQALAITLAQMLFATGRQIVDLRVNLVSLAVTVAAGTALIPRFGGGGAAAASLLSSAVYAALQYRWVRRHVADPALGGMLVRLGGVVLASVAVAMVLRPMPALSVPAGLLVFGACLLPAGLVSQSEMSWALRLATQAPSDNLKKRDPIGSMGEC